ncbi:MAG: hypothetical protein KGL10_08640 [Alphaproteobacteria bacterium]|nr:hypothetical protein [Alphaproteobacteria bacterium]
MSDNVLQKDAVGALGPDEAGEILTAYLNTGPGMVQSHTVPAAPAQPVPGGVNNPG